MRRQAVTRGGPRHWLIQPRGLRSRQGQLALHSATHASRCLCAARLLCTCGRQSLRVWRERVYRRSRGVADVRHRLGGLRALRGPERALIVESTRGHWGVAEVHPPGSCTTALTRRSKDTTHIRSLRTPTVRDFALETSLYTLETQYGVFAQFLSRYYRNRRLTVTLAQPFITTLSAESPARRRGSRPGGSLRE